MQLASKYGVRYTRYVDDLTFSTNESDFPKSIVKKSEGGEDWVVGKELKSLVERSGFSINSKKTRVQYFVSRQDVTGLVVNERVNIPSSYRRLARAMAHRLFMTGEFERVIKEVGEDGKVSEKSKPGTLDQLTGVFPISSGSMSMKGGAERMEGQSSPQNYRCSKCLEIFFFIGIFMLTRSL